MGDGGQHARMGEAHVKERVLVDEVGQALRAHLRVHLAARFVAFFREQLVEPGAKLCDFTGGKNAVEKQKTLVIKGVFFFLGERVRADSKLAKCGAAFYIGGIQGIHAYLKLGVRCSKRRRTGSTSL